MRIVVWGINYAPELTGIGPFSTGMCDFLRGQGHQVEMVAGFPYYPFWRKLPGDSAQVYRSEDLDGVWVHRCWQFVPRRSSTLKRICHEASFALTSFLRVLFLARPDVYVVVSPPLLLGPLAAVIGWLKRRPFVFHVQDLQPDAAVGLGMVRPGRFTRLLYLIEAFSYRHATVVSGISDGMISAFAQKGVMAANRLLFPNWLRWYGRNVDSSELHEDSVAQAATFRKKFGIREDIFIASYSGNLGRKQGLETLVEAAALLQESAVATMGAGVDGRKVPAAMPCSTGDSLKNERRRELLILIVGDGVMRSELERLIASRGLRNVRMMSLLAEVDYHGMVAASQVSLILQSPGTGQYFFPSKLLSVLSMRSPVVSVADDSSELAKAVASGGFGVNVPPANPAALAASLTELLENSGRIESLRSKTGWVDQYSASVVLSDFERRLIELTGIVRPI